jgi:hypothetical protein
LVGTTFQRNVLLIEAEKKGASSLRGLVNAFEKEARAAGATRLDITGHAIVNKGFFSPALAQRFGFQFRRINEQTIELVKELLLWPTRLRPFVRSGWCGGFASRARTAR